MTTPNRPATYADAGVSIEAGNQLVKMIAPLVRATRRPGADAEIGGFGGLFDLKAAGFTDPLPRHRGRQPSLPPDPSAPRCRELRSPLRPARSGRR